MTVPADVVILGGGVGGTLTANLLAKRLGRDRVRVRLVDATGLHVYQPGFLYVALGQAKTCRLARDTRSLLHRDVDLIIDRAVKLDPGGRQVILETEEPIRYDYLVVATGARLDRDAVPGLHATHDFYSLTGAERLREALRTFRGGTLLVGVAGIPYKCPPAPVEFTLMLEEYLRKRKLRDQTTIKFLSPLNRAFTIESASKMVEPIFEQRGIELHTFVNVESVDAERKQLTSLEGETFDFDLAVLVPPHKGAEVIAESGMAGPGGWLPTDPKTLEVKGQNHVFAVGDASDLPISKSGSTAHFEAPVVVEQITADLEGRAPDPVKSKYRGKVMCFVHTGGRKGTVLIFDYDHPPKPPRPSVIWHAAKWLFNRVYWLTVPKGRI